MLYSYNPSLAWRSLPCLPTWDSLSVPNYCGMLALELSRRVERSSFLALAPCNLYSSASKEEGNAN